MALESQETAAEGGDEDRLHKQAAHRLGNRHSGHAVAELECRRHKAAPMKRDKALNDGISGRQMSSLQLQVIRADKVECGECKNDH